ncbi:MAG: dynamin family protein [Cyanobacteria bacterium J06626_6]
MTPQPHNFSADLDRVFRVRQQVADALLKMSAAIEAVEEKGADGSGEFGLAQTIRGLDSASQRLRQGVFRLMVLGDMKRGKSTFLNALLGEDLLPSAVNPCTAVLTILRYGIEKQVTVHFLDGQLPETMDFEVFKQRYTIDPAEVKLLDGTRERAFPNVSHAVATYPLSLLGKGVEIVDSPGLNDTEARNELSLGYINSCHAVLFLLRATQPCTLAERRYLETYLKGRGLTVFFLLNGWDQIKESLLDPDDQGEVTAAEAKLHRLFRTHLVDYCQAEVSQENQDGYDQRVFPISALETLRNRLRHPALSLEEAGAETGFAAFIQVLSTFLTQARVAAELRPVCKLAEDGCDRLESAVTLRLSLLTQDIDGLKQRILSVQPEFDELGAICDRFQAEIRGVRDRQANDIAQSLRTHLSQLENTFEADFLRYQPELGLDEFISGQGREAFTVKLQKAFEQYVNDQFHRWSKQAEQAVQVAFAQLAHSAQDYGVAYQAVTDRMGEKLMGGAYIKIPRTHPHTEAQQNQPGWVQWATGIASLSQGDVTGLLTVTAGVDWQRLTVDLVMAGSVTLVMGAILGPVGVAIAGLGVGAMQLDQARQALKQALIKQLPTLANTHGPMVRREVTASFNRYEVQVMERIVQDIRRRKVELDNFVMQKEAHEINREAEADRLNGVATVVRAECNRIHEIYQETLSGACE